MNSIINLIKYNKQKIKYLQSYLTLNDMTVDLLDKSNLGAVSNLRPKKKALITSVNLLDDKIIAALDDIKEEYEISEISQLKAAEFPELSELKTISSEVLKLMLEVKNSDSRLFEKIDLTFEDYKNEKGKYDKGKLEAYTNKFFE